MTIIINLDNHLLQQKLSSSELATNINITKSNLSVIKNNKAKLIRFSTLNSICKTLNCQPGDILKYVPDTKKL
ncbi:helix-turn-helix transcriptional regulator [Sedimentibacter sp.]|jgi:putative transcriptional regulator|uniref:helix-turn-helix domain-containing protein n=1 Tax=Sedimentibacter sp. TaxID=1960295 RepID=UPI00289BE005|nr:helix-turn-helix transcriptional regulator [Sedimentibacter sp.]